MSSKKSNFSILIVSDDPTDHHQISAQLKPTEYLISIVGDSEQALRLLKKLAVDVILFNINPASENTEKLTQFMQSVKGISVIFMIEQSSIVHIDRYFSAGAYDVLTKPIHSKMLLNRIVFVRMRLQQITLQKQLDELQEMAELGNIVAEVIHEVATPLSNIQLLIDYLIEQNKETYQLYLNGKLSKKSLERLFLKSKKTLDMSKSNIELATNILFSFKRVSVDQLISQRITFNLLHYINDILLTLRPKLKKYTHQVSLDIADDIMITSVPGVFSQIIINFVNNTLLHAFEDNTQGKIEIKAHYIDDVLQIIYRDNGIGMDSSTLEHAFDKFYTTKVNDGGTGLGLHICKELVEDRLGGRLLLESKLGLGTTFTIMIDKNDSK
jgi:signal transduction histidine kinase